jgi:hypothetical protein
VQKAWRRRLRDLPFASKYLRMLFSKESKFLTEYFAKKSTALAKKVQKKAKSIEPEVVKELLALYGSYKA